jgi:hypothetical protein
MGFDFDAAVSAPFRMQPGLRRLAPGAPQLTPIAPGSRHQREKLAVLSAFAGQALLVREGFDAGAALAALASQAAEEHPEHFGWDGQRAVAHTLGVAVEGGQVDEFSAGVFGLGDEIGRCLRGLPASWRLAGLLSLAFAEDFAIVDGTDATIPWLAVTLPSHWAPEQKVGRPFAAVHAPVADNALLLAASERLVGLVCGADRWERFVWTITSHPRLHAHPARLAHERWPAGANAEALAAMAWFRTERQTFIPLPDRRQAVFTILVELTSLAEATQLPGRAVALRDALASMTPAVLDYRGLAPVRDSLVEWLDQRASPP